MNETRLLAEKILISAAKSSDGNCYPSQISANNVEIETALRLLDMYGRTFLPGKGALPIFTINELGRHFASTGAWSGKEREERLITEQYHAQMDAQKTNNRLVKWSMVVTIVMGLLSIFASLLIALFL